MPTDRAEIGEREGDIAPREANNTATTFISDELWDAANWNATTFKWHPTGIAPPVIGIVFQNAIPAQELFGLWNRSRGNEDVANELRVSIIEGEVSSQHRGYIVHISAQARRADFCAFGNGGPSTESAFIFSRLNRVYPKGGLSSLLDRFKQEYQKHGEYLLAPVTRRGDKDWIDVELGIVKTEICFRRIEDIGDGDVDFIAMKTATVRPPSDLER